MSTTSFLQEITRVPQAGLIKRFTFALLIVLLSCESGKEKLESTLRAMPQVEVEKKLLELKPIQGKWYYNNRPFSGYALRCFPDGSTKERVAYLEGKREGEALRWYENGFLRKEAHYKANRLYGKLNTYWPNGSLASELNYIEGMKNGTQKRWYANGTLARRTHYRLGIEEGLQQAWLENGKIYVNYEAKHGRSFGLRKAKLCYDLNDEVVQR